ncbi:MAG: hypothetical protein EBY83_04735, partial [Verrucomicrobia bacterium]|nr:hypothetical protein [Verrucomicrobiota bacterium]
MRPIRSKGPRPIGKIERKQAGCLILIRYDKVGADLPTHFFSLHRQVIPPLRTIKRIILKMQREEIMKKLAALLLFVGLSATAHAQTDAQLRADGTKAGNTDNV